MSGGRFCIWTVLQCERSDYEGTRAGSSIDLKEKKFDANAGLRLGALRFSGSGGVREICGKVNIDMTEI